MQSQVICLWIKKHQLFCTKRKVWIVKSGIYLVCCWDQNYQRQQISQETLRVEVTGALGQPPLHSIPPPRMNYSSLPLLEKQQCRWFADGHLSKRCLERQMHQVSFQKVWSCTQHGGGGNRIFSEPVTVHFQRCCGKQQVWLWRL